MSLKAFHLFFIAMSVILSAFVAAWAVAQYRVVPDASYVATCAVSAILGAGLVVYGVKFQRRSARL